MIWWSKSSGFSTNFTTYITATQGHLECSNFIWNRPQTIFFLFLTNGWWRWGERLKIHIFGRRATIVLKNNDLRTCNIRSPKSPLELRNLLLPHWLSEFRLHPLCNNDDIEIHPSNLFYHGSVKMGIAEMRYKTWVLCLLSGMNQSRVLIFMPQNILHFLRTLKKLLEIYDRVGVSLN